MKKEDSPDYSGPYTVDGLGHSAETLCFPTKQGFVSDLGHFLCMKLGEMFAKKTVSRQ